MAYLQSCRKHFPWVRRFEERGTLTNLAAAANTAKQAGDWDRAGAVFEAATPSPATHAIWIQLKAGETVFCILCRAYKTLLDSI